jgi:hypothetical protein
MGQLESRPHYQGATRVIADVTAVRKFQWAQ